MATILFNTTQTLPIPYFSDYNSSIHNPNGIDFVILKSVLWEQHMIFLMQSYNTIKENYNYLRDITTANETNLIEDLTIHSYEADACKKLHHRKFDKTKLVDLIELDLKNTKSYLQAIQTFVRLVYKLL